VPDTVKPMSDSDVGIVLAVYADNAEHGRHHETERSAFANIVVAGTAALTIFMATKDFSSRFWFFPLTISALGYYGLLMSNKAYERFELHRERLRECRAKLQLGHPNADLDGINSRARATIEAKYGRTTRLHDLWKNFNYAIIAAGLVATSVLAFQQARPAVHCLWSFDSPDCLSARKLVP